MESGTQRDMIIHINTSGQDEAYMLAALGRRNGWYQFHRVPSCCMVLILDLKSLKVKPGSTSLLRAWRGAQHIL